MIINNLYFNTIPSFSQGNLISLFDDEKFIVENVEGLRAGQIELATTDNPYRMGDIVQNKRLLPKDITVTLKPTADKGNYSKLFDTFARYLGNTVYLLWKNRETADGTFSMLLEGVMTECELPAFEDGTRVSFTIHCETPLWRSMGGAITFTGMSLTLKGNAPPDDVQITVPNGTIPSGAGNYLKVNECWFHSRTSATGDISIYLSDTIKQIKVGAVSRLDTVASPFTVLGLKGYISVVSDVNGEITFNNFSVSYDPRWY